MPRPRAAVIRVSLFFVGAWVYVACEGRPDGIIVPEETAILVSVSTALNSQFNRAGDEIRVHLVRDVRVDDIIAIGAGQGAILRISRAHVADGESPARLFIQLVAVDSPSGRRRLQTHELELVGEEAAGSGSAAAGNRPSFGRVLGVHSEYVEHVATRGTAIVLPAGQRIQLVTSRPLEMPALD